MNNGFTFGCIPSIIHNVENECELQDRLSTHPMDVFLEVIAAVVVHDRTRHSKSPMHAGGNGAADARADPSRARPPLSQRRMHNGVNHRLQHLANGGEQVDQTRMPKQGRPHHAATERIHPLYTC
jgi:hypothetical protein